MASTECELLVSMAKCLIRFRMAARVGHSGRHCSPTVRDVTHAVEDCMKCVGTSYANTPSETLMDETVDELLLGYALAPPEQESNPLDLRRPLKPRRKR